MIRRRRTVLLITLAGAGALALSGCSPRETAVMGVGVDDGGAPVAYVVACSDSIDTISLTQPGTALLGEWGAPEAVTATASVPLSDGGGWTVFSGGAPDLAPGEEYQLSGWEDSRDHVTAIDVEFTADDLAALEPGEVRRRAGVNDDGDRSYVVETEQQFAANACEYLSGRG